MKKYKLKGFIESPRKNKKYRAILSGNKYVDFGDKRYQHFTDKIGLYTHLNHYDTHRRLNYHARHRGFIKKGFYSPGYFSMNYLW